MGTVTVDEWKEIHGRLYTMIDDLDSLKDRLGAFASADVYFSLGCASGKLSETRALIGRDIVQAARS